MTDDFFPNDDMEPSDSFPSSDDFLRAASNYFVAQREKVEKAIEEGVEYVSDEMIKDLISSIMAILTQPPLLPQVFELLQKTENAFAANKRLEEWYGLQTQIYLISVNSMDNAELSDEIQRLIRIRTGAVQAFKGNLDGKKGAIHLYKEALDYAIDKEVEAGQLIPMDLPNKSSWVRAKLCLLEVQVGRMDFDDILHECKALIANINEVFNAESWAAANLREPSRAKWFLGKAIHNYRQNLFLVYTTLSNASARYPDGPDKVNKSYESFVYGQQAMLYAASLKDDNLFLIAATPVLEYALQMKRYQLADQIAAKLESIKVNLHTYEAKATYYTNIAPYYVCRGDYNAAIKHYRFALQMQKKTHDVRHRAQMYHGYGMALMYKEQHAEALHYLEEAASLYEETGLTRLVADTQWAIAWVSKLSGDLKRAHDELVKLREYYESLPESDLKTQRLKDIKKDIEDIKHDMIAM